jgi:hypothetical protein
MPGLYKIARWKLLYRMSLHGVSMNTFFTRLSGEPATLVLLEDENGWKFGAMAHADWEKRTQFYGSSETFVFTFRNGETVQYWEATGKNDMY